MSQEKFSPAQAIIRPLDVITRIPAEEAAARQVAATRQGADDALFGLIPDGRSQIVRKIDAEEAPTVVVPEIGPPMSRTEAAGRQVLSVIKNSIPCQKNNIT